jgi:hypothetical protein
VHFILIALAALLGLGTPSPGLSARHGAAASTAPHGAAAPVSAPTPPPTPMDGVLGGGPV